MKCVGNQGNEGGLEVCLVSGVGGGVLAKWVHDDGRDLCFGGCEIEKDVEEEKIEGIRRSHGRVDEFVPVIIC